MKLVVTSVLIVIFSIGCSNDFDDKQEVDSVLHIHDMAFDREESEMLYVGTHHGLLQIDLNDGMKWQGGTEDRHDFMGFTITAENKFVSSGHPDPTSNLENPLGVMESEDKGESWTMDKLYGEVDFHFIDVNEGDSSVLYGFDAFGQRLMRSNNEGEDWGSVSSNGIDDRLEDLYFIISNPDNSEEVLATMADGIYKSEDSGESFELMNNQLTLTTADLTDDGVLYAYGLGSTEGLMISDDFGRSWEAIGAFSSSEAVISIAVDSDSSIIALGTADDSIYWSEDQGESWHMIVEEGDPVI